MQKLMKDWLDRAWLAVGATAGAAVPSIMQMQSGGVTIGEAVAAVGAGVAGMSASTLASRLANSIGDEANQEILDPNALLSNHHLHRLSGQAVALIVQSYASTLESDHAKSKLQDLASHIPAAWDALSERPLYREAIGRVTQDELSTYFLSASGEDGATALTPDHWHGILLAINNDQKCNVAEVDLRAAADLLHTRLPIAVRELLKKDEAEAFAGFQIKMFGEILAAQTQIAFEVGMIGDDIGRVRDRLTRLEQTITTLADGLIQRIDKQQAGNQQIIDSYLDQLDRWQHRFQAELDKLSSNVAAGRRENQTGFLRLERLIKNQSDSDSEGDPGQHEPIASGTRNFVARSKQLGQLTRLMLPSKPNGKERIAYLWGMPGAGKSFLAEHWIRKSWLKEYGDDAVLVHLTLPSGDDVDQIDFDDLFLQLCSQFDLSPKSPNIWSQLRERLSADGMLLLVENIDAERPAKIVSQLLHRLGGVPSLVTGRLANVGATQGWKQIEVQAFDVNDGIRQLKRELGAKFKTFELAELESLVRTLGGLPLAIHIAASHLLLEGLSPLEFVQELHRLGLNVAPADYADPRLAADAARAVLDSSFQISWNAVERMAGEDAVRWQQAIASLGHAPLSGFKPSLGAAIAGLEEDDYLRCCRLAQKLSLVIFQDTQKRSYRLHPLLARWLRDRDSESAAIDRMNEWFINRMHLQPDSGEETFALNREALEEYDALGWWLTQLDVETFGRDG